LAAKDLVYDDATGKIYASIPSRAGAIGNTLTAIDPNTGALGASIFVGSEPGKLAISHDGEFIYVALDGAAAVRRVDLASQTAGLQFALGNDPSYGPLFAEDIAVSPNNPYTIAASLRRSGVSPRHGGVAIYDDGVKRLLQTASHTGANVIEFSHTEATLYGYNNETTEYGFRTMWVDASGVVVGRVDRDLISGFYQNFVVEGGLVFATSGRVVEPIEPSLLGTFSGVTTNPVAADEAIRRAFFVTGSDSATTKTVQAFDQQTYQLVGSFNVSNAGGKILSLIRWGNDGLAFTTANDRVFLIRAPQQVCLSQ